jgi:hypothetical protein
MSELFSIRITSDIPHPTSHIRHLLGRILPTTILLNSLIFAVRLADQSRCAMWDVRWRI